MQWWWKPVDKVVQTVGPGEAAWGGTVPPHTSASVPISGGLADFRGLILSKMEVGFLRSSLLGQLNGL